jgi:hypothetical protein
MLYMMSTLRHCHPVHFFELYEKEREDLHKEFAKGPFESTCHPQLLTKCQNASAVDVAAWIRCKNDGVLVPERAKLIASVVCR